MRFGIERRHAVGRYFDGIVAISGVGRRVHYANIGAYAAYYDLVRVQIGETPFEVGFEKRAVSSLGHHLSIVTCEFWNELLFARPYHAVNRKHFEFEIVRNVVVAKKDYARAFVDFTLDQLLHVRDDFAGFVSTVKCSSWFEKSVNHIDYQNYVTHG